MTSVEKPPNQRCSFCLPNGTCDQAAFRLGFCGLAKLVDAIEDDASLT